MVDHKFVDKLKAQIDTTLLSRTGGGLSGPEVDYLRTPAPNICEWVNGVDYWNVPSTISDHKRQYQIMRDVFSLRCPICNPMKPEDIDCWGKSRMYLESEILLVWSESGQDFLCPKCGNSQRELIADGMFTPYNEMIILAGMRSGKSYLGAHIGGYFEHFVSTRAMHGQGYLQRWLKQEKAEWFEVTFAASTATQAAQTIYAKYREMRKNSPWVQRYMSWVRDFEKQQKGGDEWTYRMNDDAVLDGWAKVRYNRIASDSRGVAGRTRLAASIDEWARLADTEGTRSAKELYRVLNQSLKTIRAAVELNKLPLFFGLMVNVTSPIAQDDPAMETYNKAVEGELLRTYAWKGATWEFNPQLPRHVFDEEYVRDPVAAERDFGANPPNAESPFVDDPKRFWKSIDFERDPIATFSTAYLTDPTGKAYVAAELDNCMLNHTDVHYIFGDAGLTWDSFALVCAHAEWLDASELEAPDEIGPDGKPLPRALIAPPARGRIEPQTQYDVVFAEDMGTFMGANVPVGADGPMIMGAQAERRRAQNYFTASTGRQKPFDHMGEMLCTVIDFAVRIVPDTERDIWFNSVVNIIEGLQKKIRIAGIAFDHWNSESTIQQLRTMGLLATKVTLKTEHFMGFLRMAYNGRVKMLPPDPRDTLGITGTGALVIGTPQEEMYGQSIALVELLKLTRSPDLRRFFNPKKGQVRGKDSDDLARCYVGAHHLVQDSIVDSQANQKRRNDRRKRQIGTDTSMMGLVHRGGGNW